MATALEKESHQLHPNQTLAFTIEVDFSRDPLSYHCTETALFQSLQHIERCVGLIKAEDIKLFVRDSAPVTFNQVHERSCPKEYFEAPITMELFSYATEKGYTLLGKLFVNLKYYDGVTAVHTFFNLLEVFENSADQSLTPEEYLSKGDHFTQSYKNCTFGAEQLPQIKAHYRGLVKMIPQEIGVRLRKQRDYFLGPLIALEEPFSSDRVWMRYSNAPISYKEFVTLGEKIQEFLDIPKISYTMNFSPEVGIGFVDSFEELRNRDKRIASQTFPPSAPMPMGVVSAAVLGNSIFWNNYGIHTPNIRGKVKGFVWDWYGTPKCYLPIFHNITIQGSFFATVSMSDKMWHKTQNYLSPLGAGEALSHPRIDKKWATQSSFNLFLSSIKRIKENRAKMKKMAKEAS